MHWERWYIKLELLLLPLELVPIFFFLTAEGYLNFGGGEKDIFLVFAMLIWAVVYALIFGVCWIKKMTARQCVQHAVIGGIGLLVLAWGGLLIWSLRKAS